MSINLYEFPLGFSQKNVNENENETHNIYYQNEKQRGENMEFPNKCFKIKEEENNNSAPNNFFNTGKREPFFNNENLYQEDIKEELMGKLNNSDILQTSEYFKDLPTKFDFFKKIYTLGKQNGEYDYNYDDLYTLCEYLNLIIVIISKKSNESNQYLPKKIEDIKKIVFYEQNKLKDYNNEGSYIFISKTIGNNKVIVFGDIHGSFHTFFRSMMRLYYCDILKENFKLKDGYNIIFCGDIIDRGGYSLEILAFIFKLIVENNNSGQLNIFLIRGNHEDKETYNGYGFPNEVYNKLYSLSVKNIIEKIVNKFEDYNFFEKGFEDLKKLAEEEDGNKIKIEEKEIIEKIEADVEELKKKIKGEEKFTDNNNFLILNFLFETFKEDPNESLENIINFEKERFDFDIGSITSELQNLIELNEIIKHSEKLINAQEKKKTKKTKKKIKEIMNKSRKSLNEIKEKKEIKKRLIKENNYKYKIPNKVTDDDYTEIQKKYFNFIINCFDIFLSGCPVSIVSNFNDIDISFCHGGLNTKILNSEKLEVIDDKVIINDKSKNNIMWSDLCSYNKDLRLRIDLDDVVCSKKNENEDIKILYENKQLNNNEISQLENEYGWDRNEMIFYDDLHKNTYSAIGPVDFMIRGHQDNFSNNVLFYDNSICKPYNAEFANGISLLNFLNNLEPDQQVELIKNTRALTITTNMDKGRRMPHDSFIIISNEETFKLKGINSIYTIKFNDLEQDDLLIGGNIKNKLNKKIIRKKKSKLRKKNKTKLKKYQKINKSSKIKKNNSKIKSKIKIYYKK